jgi:hypothetical protein
MKMTLFFLALAAFAQAPAQVPKVPRQAENIGIQTGPEKYLWLSDYAGKTCIVAVIMTTCTHCQFTTGILNRIQKDYADKGVQIVASAIEPMSSLNIPDFRKKFMPAFPVGYNDQNYLAKFLDRAPNEPMFVPQLVFIDRNGMVRVQFSGDEPGLDKEIQEKTLREALEKTLKEGQKK